MKKIATTLVICAALAACGRAGPDADNEVPVANEGPAAEAASDAATTNAPGEPGGLPDDRELVEEGPIDHKSGQGAGQVLQSYAALLEQGRVDEARLLWTDAGAGSGLGQRGFDEAYAKYADIHAEIGAPGPVEGAAGSAYVDIPVRFYGTVKGGQKFSSSGAVTLRRVNDVPGSSVEQRHWHIYRIDVQPPL